MLEKIEVFNKYYQSNRFRLELKLPLRPSFHHFRFQCFKDNTFRRLRDVVSSSQVLETVILKNTPKNVFFTPVKWLDPINVRRKRDNQVKDYMLSSPLYFDVDYDWSIGKGLEEAKEMTKTLIFILEAESGRKPDWIVFSGRRGFHIYYWDWDDILCNSSSADSRIISFRKSRETILSKLQNKGVIVDRLVTSDPWRVMRVPGTLHGETGLIAKMFTDIEDFSIEKTRP